MVEEHYGTKDGNAASQCKSCHSPSPCDPFGQLVRLGIKAQTMIKVEMPINGIFTMWLTLICFVVKIIISRNWIMGKSK